MSKTSACRGPWRKLIGRMAVLIAMLRGVNVGGHQKLPSATLKSVCETAGLGHVRTYLQSGNVVFECAEADPERVAQRIRKQLHESTGLDVGVVVRTPAELRSVVKKNPFPDAAKNDPARLLVVFLAGKPAATAKATLDKEAILGEEIHFSGRELYVYFPQGAGRSKLANAFTEKKLGTLPTARNWNTVTALLRLAEGA